MGVVLEVAVAHERDVTGAVEGGADRLHVVGAGELSPEITTVSAVCRDTDVPVFVLLRLNDTWTTTGGELTRLVGLDVQRVLGAGAGQAQRPAARGVEQAVLNVLGDQPGDVHLPLGPLVRPPLASGDGLLEDRDRVGGRVVAGLEVGEHASPRIEQRHGVHPSHSVSRVVTVRPLG